MEKDVLLKEFSSENDAELARGLLENQGIKSIIQRGAMPRSSLLPFAKIGNTSLFVIEDDYKKALEIIKDIGETSLDSKHGLSHTNIFQKIFAITSLLVLLAGILIILRFIFVSN